MARKMAEVQAASEQAATLKVQASEKEQTMREQEIEQAAIEAARKADEAEQRKAEAKVEKERKAKERKAQPSKTKVTYVDGDGLTHKTGKVRLNVPGGQPCVCGCGETPEKKRSRFIPGHDARMYRLAKAYKGLLGSAELEAARQNITEVQKSYLKGRNLI